MLAIFTLNETEYIYRICQIFVAHFRIWGGLSNALGRLSLPKPPRGAGAANEFSIFQQGRTASGAHVLEPVDFLITDNLTRHGLILTRSSAIAERPARRCVSVEMFYCCTNNANRSPISLMSTFIKCHVLFRL